MPEGWKLDNFKDDVPKLGDDYQTIFHVDADGDGDTDCDETEPAFELRFVHLRNAGVVWLRGVAVYLLAGYLNQPSQFAAGLSDFDAFLQNIEISGQRGSSRRRQPPAVQARLRLRQRPSRLRTWLQQARQL